MHHSLVLPLPSLQHGKRRGCCAYACFADLGFSLCFRDLLSLVSAGIHSSCTICAEGAVEVDDQETSFLSRQRFYFGPFCLTMPPFSATPLYFPIHCQKAGIAPQRWLHWAPFRLLWASTPYYLAPCTEASTKTEASGISQRSLLHSPLLAQQWNIRQNGYDRETALGGCPATCHHATKMLSNVPSLLTCLRPNNPIHSLPRTYRPSG